MKGGGIETFFNQHTLAEAPFLIRILNGSLQLLVSITRGWPICLMLHEGGAESVNYMDREKEFNPLPGTLPAPFSDNTCTYTYDHHARGSPDSGTVASYVQNNPQFSASFPGFYTGGNPAEKMSFADVVQFADQRSNKLAETMVARNSESGLADPVYFLKFPVLNDELHGQQIVSLTSVTETIVGNSTERFLAVRAPEDELDGGRLENASAQFIHPVEGNNDVQKFSNITGDLKNSRKKRPRCMKTSEEVESQRMTHIAVERNRRRQMNEHLRALRSLMPGSYVQRGDQASIIGGAIEFVRELEQLLQCLESQKRRRMLAGSDQILLTRPSLDSSPPAGMHQYLSAPAHTMLPAGVPLANDSLNMTDFEAGFREEIAESKSFLADVEVKLLGFDAMIKILSRRRPGQLLKAIAALEDMQLTILHINITTIEQTVLYSFNVKVVGESRSTAEEIASSVQQIFSFIHATTNI